MKKQNGFIATSLLYSFFLGFVTLFIGMVTIYLQNRVYLNKFEDSSKNSIYIREIKELIDKSGNLTVNVNDKDENTIYIWYDGNIFYSDSSTECNFTKCETIYYSGNKGAKYILKGCPDSCEV